MVYRVYVEKKNGMSSEAEALTEELNSFLGVKGLRKLRLLNRYDVENVDSELFRKLVGTVFSEPQADVTYYELPTSDAVFAVEYLPGQFDQRASSAAECAELVALCPRPVIKTAKIYALYGELTEEDVQKIKKYVVNPVESRPAALELPEKLSEDYPHPKKVKVLDGFRALDNDGLQKFLTDYALAMDLNDLEFCRNYFEKEGRDPTMTEIRMLDTYWSDHCRHTTFLTEIDSVACDDPVLNAAYRDYIETRKALNRTKPVTLMDMATIAAKYLKAEGKLDKLDESEEINACTVKIKVTVDGKEEDWLLLFKNETHNHPTEIEPFGGAATCIGGAIRDPLSGRAYVYAAMRVTGAGDPRTPVEDTLPGKLPQRKIVTTAAAGYSSYGNQIGLATGIVDEIYDPGYVAKRMEIGAVIAAVKAENVRRETPEPGDKVILLGGRTGRDGCGGATGSSKSHTVKSLEVCGAEVQKGNAPEERKLQRLFRNAEAARLIKRCNDFGAGGVSVAIGELADGLTIDLNAVPKKYEGLDGTELAISESQERMAVVVSAGDVKRFLELSDQENLEATVVATVTEEKRLKMYWDSDKIVDISREFLNSNGAEKHIDVVLTAPEDFATEGSGDFEADIMKMAGDLNCCSKRGLSERFDSTIGAGTVLMPFGGKNQLTPIQAMVHTISTEHGETDDCSVMSRGFDPSISKKSPFHGAYYAVVESVAKLIATGAPFRDVYLTFQEYFPKPQKNPERWGLPFAALLGAFRAQKDLGIAAIGGKDSMSGSFEDIDVPPTLVSFAVTTMKADKVISGEFKKAGHAIRFLKTAVNSDNLPDVGSLKENFAIIERLNAAGKIYAAYTPERSIAEAVYKMAIGNGIGAVIDGMDERDLFARHTGSFVIETDADVTDGVLLGVTTEKQSITAGGKEVPLGRISAVYEGALESVYPVSAKGADNVHAVDYKIRSNLKSNVSVAKPRVLVPVFPGTNCEYDSAKAIERAGAKAEIFVLNNLSGENVKESVKRFAKLVGDSQSIFIPGGFSGGDEPDGSGKFITAFFRNPEISDAVADLLDNRYGLMAGICNGFQALIKLGLLPYGRILPHSDEGDPTLTFNTIGRHQSKIVSTRIASVKSPWLQKVEVGDIIKVPISHGEGRFVADKKTLETLIANGQIATQYVDLNGEVSGDIAFNPNGSVMSIEGITSPDGRIFGKMGHSERVGKYLYRNVPGRYDIGMFESLVEYFK